MTLGLYDLSGSKIWTFCRKWNILFIFESFVKSTSFIASSYQLWLILSGSTRETAAPAHCWRGLQLPISSMIFLITVGIRGQFPQGFCALTPIFCALRPTFWEASYWRKSWAQGRRAQKQFMKSTPACLLPALNLQKHDWLFLWQGCKQTSAEVDKWPLSFRSIKKNQFIGAR